MRIRAANKLIQLDLAALAPRLAPHAPTTQLARRPRVLEPILPLFWTTNHPNYNLFHADGWVFAQVVKEL